VQSEDIRLDCSFRILAVYIDRHAESLCDFRNTSADAAVSDDSQRTAGKLDNRLFDESKVNGILPFMFVYKARVKPNIVCNFQNQRKGMLCNGLRRICRNIADCDAAFFRRSNVDIIISGRRNPDKFQVRAGIHDFFRDFDFGSEECNFGRADGVDYILLRDSVVCRQIAQRSKLCPFQVVKMNRVSV